MAATILLIRHAAHDRVDHILCGRMPGVTLGDTGRRQAAALADRLARDRLDAVLTSPVQRAVETAAPIAARLGVTPEPCPGLEEIHFGAWTGARFDDLREDPDWQRWNTHRATARPPGGESMTEAQARATAAMECARATHPAGRLAMVSHADIIKSVLAGLLGLSLDHLHRFEIAPASVSALALWEGGGKVLTMNETLSARTAAA